MRDDMLLFIVCVLGNAKQMALRNYLIEGGSCSGKTSVCKELKKRGNSAIDGDNELA